MNFWKKRKRVNFFFILWELQNVKTAPGFRRFFCGQAEKTLWPFAKSFMLGVDLLKGK